MLLNEYQTAIAHLWLKNGQMIPLEVAALGLAGELGEFLEAANAAARGALDEAGQKKLSRAVLLEAGDMLWYVTAIAKHLDLDIQELDGFMQVDVSMSLIVPTGRVCDAIKKQVWHGKPLNKLYVLRDLSSILAGLRYILGTARPTSFVLEDAAAANVEKLAKRYPEGFQEGGGVRTN